MAHNKLYIFFCLTGLLGTQVTFGQIQQADSLLVLLENTKETVEKAKLNVQLSKIYERIDISKSKQFAKHALAYNNDSIKSEATNQLGRAYFYSNQLDSAAHYFQKSIDFLKSMDLPDKAAAVGISLGAVQLRNGDYKAAVNTLIEGAAFFEGINDSINMAKCYSNVSSAFGELNDSKKAIEYGEKALHIFNVKNMVPYQAVTLPNLAGEFLKLGDTLKAKTYFLEAENLAKKRNDQFSLARIYNNLGNMYLETDHEQSEKYLSQALSIRKKTKNNDGIGTLYNNLGYLYLQQGSPKKAIPYLNNALTFGQGTNESITFNNLSNAHKALGDYKSALEYANKKTFLNDSILKIENQKAIAEITTKYETEKKEKEILNLKNVNLETDIKRKQNRNLLYAALGLLLIGLILAYLWLKNSKRKRIIAEQQQELESQKVEKLLKEQELIGLDAMIEGQEKERQRIAEDLHDSLGGKLSALKLLVEDVKKADKSLYGKIKTVLDESYDDVRNISHQKNATAMIDKGLIPAVNIIANRLKSSEKLNVEVTNIDLKQKIKNFIELQLFRIIQELLTNTLKHAKASNVNIQFSEENDTLNVVYEDDGIGYDTMATKEGVGLKNINSRIQKIAGSLTVDSNPGNGTTVILNVPI
ncbi:tetratricopeptide repeat-containing sensor histidine kinase [Flagellimonas sp.]|uniref:tetratricopeptide repeat-containing sensor histidine kinase n=1 Tax=Flagellimonas sp. TaxID=2058762 RepID=UPI003B5BDA7D